MSEPIQPPAPPAPSGIPGTPGAPAAPPSTWYAGFQNADLRGYVETKGFQNPEALADSYRNLEKLRGVPADRLLSLPEKPDAPEWDAIWNRLGRPEKPDGYALQVPDGQDRGFADRMATAMHKLGITKAAAAGLNAEWNAFIADELAAAERDQQQADAADLTSLRTKWGAQYDAHVELGRRAGREFGLSEEDFTAVSRALGSGKTLELFQRIGAKLGEPGRFDADGGSSPGFGLTPDGARARLKALQSDKDWAAKYMNGDVAARQEAERLAKIASGG